MPRQSNKNMFKQRSKVHRPLLSFTSSKKRVITRSAKLTLSRDIIIKLRKFRTKAPNRSQKYRQVVIPFPLPLTKIKEIELRMIPASATKHKNLTLAYASRAVMMAGVVGLIVFGGIMSGVFQPKPPQILAESSPQEIVIKEPVVDEEPDPFTLAESNPTNILIPTIGVNASIHSVGVNEQGAIQTPDLFSDKVGWYKFGPTPGELGPAVLVGHVDTYKGPSVFWRLSTLTRGDSIEISREDGTIAEFEVTKIVQFSRDEFDTEMVYGNIDYAGLRVITCSGAFNYVTGYYSHNTVVFAKLVE